MEKFNKSSDDGQLKKYKRYSFEINRTLSMSAVHNIYICIVVPLLCERLKRSRTQKLLFLRDGFWWKKQRGIK